MVTKRPIVDSLFDFFSRRPWSFIGGSHRLPPMLLGIPAGTASAVNRNRPG